MRYEQEGYSVYYEPGDTWIIELRGEIDLDFQVVPGVFNAADQVQQRIDQVIELLPDLEAVEELLGDDLLGVVS